MKSWEAWCGTDKLSRKPNPAIDVRPELVLNATEREQTPVDWFESNVCKQQYADYLSILANRKNSINGKLYRSGGAVQG